MEAQILALRRDAHRGPVFLAGQLGLVASTVGRVLQRHHVPAPAAIDPITGAPVRRQHSGVRYERARPGVHVAVDDHTRLAHVEALADERDLSCAGFLRRPPPGSPPTA